MLYGLAELREKIYSDSDMNILLRVTAISWWKYKINENKIHGFIWHEGILLKAEVKQI